MKPLLTLSLVLLGTALFAQTTALWHDISPAMLQYEESQRQIIPEKFRTLALNFEDLKLTLSGAPLWLPEAPVDAYTDLSLPLPDGKFELFHIVEAPVFSPGLAAKYPQIKSYKGWSTKDASTTVRLDVSPQGFHAMVWSDQGIWLIDPFAKGDTQHYISYFKRDYKNPEPFYCGVEKTSEKIKTHLNPMPESGDCQFRTFRLALACTGEYAQFHGGTVPAALAAMNTSLNRVNGVFEREFALNLILIDNDDQLIYLDPDTDPYTNNDGSIMLSENQNNVDAVIGSANYDFGHVFSTGGGGIAALQSPCNPNNKAKGVTGRPAPVGDAFDIDYVVHEMGHQLGANHTQNNACNRNDPTAMEPGSASTIMGYAGICFPNVQDHSDDYYHAISLQEINNFLTNSAGCATTVTLNNNPPVVDAGPDYTIPKSTPFVLSATGSDADGTDTLRYCWEQMNPDAAPMPPDASSVVGPAFRSLNPTIDNKRFFPNLNDLLANNTPEWEVLPAVARTMKFRVTARDYHQGGGCTAEDDMILTVAGNAGPFLVTQPNTTVDWPALSIQTVKWDVAGTDAPPVSAATVDIILSLDGGLTYTDTLAQATPNDGSEVVTMPSQTTNSARIMVKGHDNVFFDISNQNFTISQAQPGFALLFNQENLQTCSPAQNSLTLNVVSFAGFNGSVNLTATAPNPNINVSISPSTVNAPATVNVQISTTAALPDGDYVIQFSGTGSPGTSGTSLTLTSFNAPPQPATLTAPANNATGISIQPLLQWNAVPNAQNYTVEIYSDQALTNLVKSATVSSPSFQTDTALNPSTTYYWRVLTANTCQQNVPSPVFSFTTEAMFCTVFNATDLPVTIPDTQDTTVTSTLNIPNSGTITSIFVPALDITHTYLGDLDIFLKGPDGTTVQLLDQICESADNILMGFDDNSPNTYFSIPCPPVSGDIYQPLDSLAKFIGKDVSGDWTLVVSDLFPADGGTINAWSLNICYLVSDLTANVVTQDVSCFGGNDGQATVSVAGGTPPYNFNWSAGNGQNLTAGNYSVTISDAAGATVVQSFTINQPQELLLVGNVTNASQGNSDGAIDLTVSGGTPGYNFAWSNGATTEDVSALAAGSYTVTVTDANGCTKTKQFTVQESCPEPANINVSIISPTSVTVSWTQAPTANSYQVRYKPVSSSSWTTQMVSTTSITIADLMPDTEYEVQVQSHCSGGWSPYSSAVHFTMPAPCNVPVNITTVSVAAESATLSWDAVPSSTSYVVNYRPSGTTTWLSQTTPTNQITLSGLTPQTSYEARVKTTCGSFASDFSDLIIFTTLQGCNPPTDLTASVVSYVSFQLDWSPIPGASKYAVRFRKKGTTNWTSQDVTNPPVTLTVQTSGVTYEYQVQTQCGIAWSQFGPLGEVTLPGGCQVSGLTASSITDHSFALTWDGTPGATKYKVSYQVAGSSDPWTDTEVNTAGASVDGLSPNTVYTVRVQAFCDLGWGEFMEIQVQTEPVGITEASAKKLLVYPNPAQNTLYLNFVSMPENVGLFDVLGRQILTAAPRLKMEMDISGLRDGVYLVRANFADGEVTYVRFVKR